MKTMDESLLKTCSILNDVNNEKAKCLIMFADCKNLILWLRESMRSKCHFRRNTVYKRFLFPAYESSV